MVIEGDELRMVQSNTIAKMSPMQGMKERAMHRECGAAHRRGRSHI